MYVIATVTLLMVGVNSGNQNLGLNWKFVSKPDFKDLVFASIVNG
jgi:hypothetical protein